MSSETRAERRRRERAEAKLHRQINRRFTKADEHAARLIPKLEAMRETAVRRGWQDVAAHTAAAMRAVEAGEGIEAQRHVAAAVDAIDKRQAQKA